MKDVRKLKSGDIIWVDEEPYSLRGKVYGYTCEMITNIEKFKERIKGEIKTSYRIHYSAGFLVFPWVGGIYKLMYPEKLFSLLQDEKYTEALSQPL